ncbi:RNA-binding protein 34 isoform 2-T2 [Pholidichthys leucotaenia]
MLHPGGSICVWHRFGLGERTCFEFCFQCSRRARLFLIIHGEGRSRRAVEGGWSFLEEAMKKKEQHSRGASLQQRADDYVVGQVSGSLFQKNSTASGSLSALFSTAAPATPVLFTPPPPPVQKKTETKTVPENSLKVKSDRCQQKKKKKKKSSQENTTANQTLENRESGLREADEKERGDESSMRKRKASDRDKDAEYWVMKRRKLKDSKKEEALKARRTVFVGNLPVSCTKKMLLRLFREKGAVESVRFRSVVREDPSMSHKVAAIKRKVHPKKQSINAYVVFKDEDAVAKALDRNGVEIEEGFHIRVDRVTEGSLHDHKRSVFVGNLSFDLSEAAFRSHFEECGTVEGVRLVRDKNSGMGKGFGYVLFQSADSVQLALKLNGSKLEDRSIRVQRSVKKERQKQDGKGASRRTSRGTVKSPKKGPSKDSGQQKGAGRGGLKVVKKLRGKQQNMVKTSTSFKGEMANPNRKTKKKGMKKKKVKPNKSIHI